MLDQVQHDNEVVCHPELDSGSITVCVIKRDAETSSA